MEKGFIEITQRDNTKRYIKVSDIDWFNELNGYVTICMTNKQLYHLQDGLTAEQFNDMVKETQTLTVNESVSIEHGDFEIDGEVMLKQPIVIELLNQLEDLGITLTWPNPLHINLDNPASSINIGTMPDQTVKETQVPLSVAHAVISVTTSAVTVLAAATARKYLLLVNGGLLPILVRLGTGATTSNTIKLYAGQRYEFPRGLIYTGTITAIMVSGTGTLHAMEGT
ncbi:hypothetical protein [Paenibacillus sinopodophylli]|uniref:hypothetical protein n=1 Tax=Paenibacillus sinopodophylli TaxID=1837342 RepID=UPI00110CE6D2|nr:hypothetical protein [Paenibacillus sinopodophylli]